jgi:hypothetical protein
MSFALKLPLPHWSSVLPSMPMRSNLLRIKSWAPGRLNVECKASRRNSAVG